MNIMMGINNKYVFPTKVMLTSLCENNKFEKHFVYILYDRKNLTKENIESIKILEKQYEIEICPIAVSYTHLDLWRMMPSPLVTMPNLKT